jgi:formylglycine-generating enzyme required for sulfatase activity
MFSMRAVTGVFDKPAPAAEPSLPAVVTNSIGMKLALIPAGEFEMGNPRTPEEETAFFQRYSNQFKPERFQNEYPRHRVRITRPFYLGVHEVTLKQFGRFVRDTDYRTEAETGKPKGAWRFFPEKGRSGFDADASWRNPGYPQGDDHPAVVVSYNDALAFCAWLSRKEHAKYRLPTEAEWEYACRAGTTTRYSSGDDPESLAQVANVLDATAKQRLPAIGGSAIGFSDGYAFTAPVGRFRPNAWGLCDMHGNVWEWCADWYGADSYAHSPVDDPLGPETGTVRVLRGGAWSELPVWGVRSSFRGHIPPTIRAGAYIGFRVARSE